MLVGRISECAVLDELLERAKRSQGGAVVLRGEAGVGKSALLEYAERRGVRHLRGTGVQAESEFPYAAAHQLLRPLLGLTASLPVPQAQALDVALGMAPGGPPDRFLVALGFLSLLSEAGREEPLLCVLDDIQWCDSASTDALLFAVRRLVTDPVVFVFAVRDEPGVDRFEVPGVAEVELSGLSDEAGLELLSGLAGSAVPPEVGVALVARTRGNPLALGELARLLDRDQLTGRAALPDPLPGGDRLEHAFLDRARQLTAAAQGVLLLAAAEESDELEIVLAAAGELGGAETALDEAERSGLLSRRQGTLQLCHPLVRSAVYLAAAPSARRAAHQALAQQLEVRGHLDRRAWHLAAASTGPDEWLAGELDRLAQRAGLRSAHGAASAGFERASDLSATTADRTRRLIAAADSAWLAGQVSRVRELVNRAEELTEDPVPLAHLLHLRARHAIRNGDVDVAYRTFCDGAELVRVAAPPQALEMLANAVDAAMYAGDPVRAGEAARKADDVDPGPDARQRFTHAWLASMSAAMQGKSAQSAGLVRTCISLADDLTDPRQLTWAGIAAVNLGDIAVVRALFRKAVDCARRSGAIATLPYPLEKWAMTEALAGNFSSARSAAEEGLALAEETEQLASAYHLHATLALVAATCGDEDECRRHAREALDGAVSRGLGLPIANVSWAFGRLDLGLGRYPSALDHLASMQNSKPGRGNPVIALWAIPDLVESAVRAGRPADAAEALERLTGWAAAGGQPAALASVARCRALMGDPQGETLLTEAVEAFRTAHSPYEEARTELVLGELLRRQRRRSEARKHLRAAFGTFERLGAGAWADRAAVELRATGETVQTVQRDGAEGIHQLTSQELQIIRHVCLGESNRGVAAQLFISPRTVEYHLYKAYPKLGVSSRAQLISRFGDDAELAALR